MSEKVRKRGCDGAVAEGTIAPSGTWWTTLGPKDRSGQLTALLESQVGLINLLTLLGVELAVEDRFDHGGCRGDEGGRSQML